MKAKEITVSFGGTVNLGNYENFKIDLSVTAETEAFPSIYEIERQTQELFRIVRGLVRDEVAKLESRNVRGWLRDTDLKESLKPQSPAETPAPETGDAPGDADKFLF